MPCWLRLAVSARIRLSIRACARQSGTVIIVPLATGLRTSDAQGSVKGCLRRSGGYSELVNRNKKIRAHCYAHANHSAPHLPGISLLSVMRTEPTPGERADYHHCAMWPQYGFGNDKGNHRSSIDGSS